MPQKTHFEKLRFLVSQVGFKSNDLYKSTKVTNNPHSILLKLRNPHNPHSSFKTVLKSFIIHSFKNE